MYGSNWQAAVLIPFWVIRTLSSIVLIILSALALVLVTTWESETDEQFSNFTKGELVFGPAILLSWCGITLIFDITEVILLARRRLSPVVAVVLGSVKELLSLVLLILTAMGTAQAHTHDGLILLLGIIIFSTTTGQLIYASVVLHRYRKGGQQHRGTYQQAYAKAATVSDDDFAYGPSRSFNPFRDTSRGPSPDPNPSMSGMTRYYDGSAPIEPMYDPHQHAGRYA